MESPLTPASHLPSVLLVDDTPANLVALEAVLAPLGARLMLARSGDEALRQILAEDFACILLDVQMPGLDGFEVARLIKGRERTRLTPILFVTAVSREESQIIRGYSEGAVDYILKPFEPDILRAKVRVFVELYRRESKLRREEALLRERTHRALEAAQVGSWQWDLGTRRMEWSPNLERLFGQKPGSFGSTYAEYLGLIHPDDRERVAAQMAEAVRTLGAYTVEHRVLWPDGTVHWYLTQGSVLTHGPAGTLAGIVQDITVQRALEEQREAVDAALRVSEERLLRVVEASDVGIWELDLATQEVKADARLLVLFGLEPTRSVSLENLTGGIHPADRARVAGALAAALRGEGRGRYWEEYRTGGAGEVRWVEVRGQAYFDEQGKAVRFLGTGQDITERKRVQAERESLLESQAETIRQRDRFLSVASHELKTPLSSLALRLAQLRRVLQGLSHVTMTPGQQLLHVEAAEAQVQRLADLAEGVLEVALLARQELTLDLEDLEVDAVVREAVEALRPEARKVGSELRLEVQGPVRGRFDRERLSQVVTSLLSNALKFGEGKPVSVALAAQGDRLRLTIRDEGIGIQPEDLERVFAKFERAVSERHYSGLGLGLYLARGLVKAMGGEVRVASLPGQGATFTVELPLGEAAATS